MQEPQDSLDSFFDVYLCYLGPVSWASHLNLLPGLPSRVAAVSDDSRGGHEVFPSRIPSGGSPSGGSGGEGGEVVGKRWQAVVPDGCNLLYLFIWRAAFLVHTQ